MFDLSRYIVKRITCNKLDDHGSLTWASCPGGYSHIFAIRGRAAGQGMVFGLAVLNRVYISPEIVLNRLYNLDKRDRYNFFLCLGQGNIFITP